MTTIKQDSKVMELLKVTTINRIICNTDKGYLTLQIRKGEREYHLVLDAVPLEEEVNKELMEVLFPIKVNVVANGVVFVPNATKVLTPIMSQTSTTTPPIVAQTETIPILASDVKKVVDNNDGTHTLVIKKKGGRPKGSKNKNAKSN